MQMVNASFDSDYTDSQADTTYHCYEEHDDQDDAYATGTARSQFRKTDLRDQHNVLKL
jgi:hypothetical protein